MPGNNDFFQQLELAQYLNSNSPNEIEARQLKEAIEKMRRHQEAAAELANANWQLSMKCPNPDCWGGSVLAPTGKPFNGHTQLRCSDCGFKFTIRGEIESPDAQEKKKLKRESDTGKKFRLDMDKLKKDVKEFELK